MAGRGYEAGSGVGGVGVGTVTGQFKIQRKKDQGLVNSSPEQYLVQSSLQLRLEEGYNQALFHPLIFLAS